MSAALLLVGAGTAYALRLQVGNIVLIANGGFSPTALPKYEDAPIKLHGYAKIGTADGSLPSPLTSFVIEYDKHGHVETRGLPVCTRRQLLVTTTEKARENCRESIIGKGLGKGVVKFPDQGRIAISSPITIFNGPKKNGNPTVFGHAYLDEPVGPVTYIVPVVIEKINKGRYGFRTEAKIPTIAGGYGHPTYGRIAVGHTWKYKGKTLSFANARCPDGRLQANAQFNFKDGTFLQGTVFRLCTVRK